MDTCTCSGIISHLAHLRHTTDATIDSTLVHHIAHCPTCRGALLLLMADLVDLPPLPAQSTCTQCMADLAAYIDTELDLSAHDARLTYPHVWWHLWLCPVCAVTYHDMRTLAQATRAGELDLAVLTPWSLAPSPTRWYTTHLASIVFAEVYRSTQSIAGPLRSTTRHDPQVVLCDEHAGHTIELALQPDDHTSWCAILQIDPPLVGTIQLTWGPYQQQGALDGQGQALLPDIPISYFRQPPEAEIMVTVLAADPDPL